MYYGKPKFTILKPVSLRINNYNDRITSENTRQNHKGHQAFTANIDNLIRVQTKRQLKITEVDKRRTRSRC